MSASLCLRSIVAPGRTWAPGFALLLSFMLVAVAGCGSGRPIKYYQLTYPSAEPASPSALDVVLMVRPLEASPLYLDDKIVYGLDGPQMGTYQNHRWEEPPIEILQTALIRGLRASGHFRAVYTIRSDANGRFLLGGYLYDFKEVDMKPIVARLNYEVRLRDRKTSTTVWSHSYSHDEPASEKTVNAFVIAMDKNVKRSVEEIQAGLDEYFQSHPLN
jgi:ABC-type uncharacterized transport system auxiliary subunit